jgi:hypothetical protein
MTTRALLLTHSPSRGLDFSICVGIKKAACGVQRTLCRVLFFSGAKIRSFFELAKFFFEEAEGEMVFMGG